MKMTMSKLYLDILNERQRQVLRSLKGFSEYGYLAGGTALALQIYHRRSFDFDIFCKKPISKRFIFKIKESFKKIDILVDSSDEMSFISGAGVKISFIFYPFKPLYKVISWDIIDICNWKDIAIDKAHTIGRRGEWRDYVDLYFCIKAGLPFKNIIREAKRKFGDIFSEKLFLSQLCFVNDIRDFTIDFVKEDIKPSQIRAFFEGEVERLKIV